MKFFIASPWRNKESVEHLTEELVKQGHEVYSFLQSGANLTTGLSIEEELKTFGEALTNWENDPNIKKIFDAELAGLAKSDTLICVMASSRILSLPRNIFFLDGVQRSLASQLSVAELRGGGYL